MTRGGSMARRRGQIGTQIAAGLFVGLLVAGCTSRTGPAVAPTPGETFDDGVVAGDDFSGGAGGKSGKGGANAGAGGGGSAVAGSGGGSTSSGGAGSAGSAAATFGGEAQRGNIKVAEEGATYQGVTAREIRVVFGYQPEPCGQDPNAFIERAFPQSDPVASIKTAVQYFNDHARDVFGVDLPAGLRQEIGPRGFYGRFVKGILVEDHGDFCPEQSRADAQAAAERYKPFAAVGGSYEWDDEMTRRRIMRLTTRPALNSYFTSRRPYMWGPITGASDINFFLGGYAGRFLKGKRSTDTGHPLTSGVPRKYGIIHLDDEDTRAAVKDLRQQFAKRGVRISRVVGYEPNLGTIGSQATNAMLQMKQDGITTIFMVMDPIAVQFMSQAADSQDYYPEWISNTYGLMDWSLGPRTFMTRRQASNTFGISVYWPSRQVREEQTEAYRAWKSVHPDSDPPDDFSLYYTSAKALFRGIALAGPVLHPGNYERGMNAYCNPCGRSIATDPLTGYGAGDFTAIDDAHLQRYDPDKPDYSAPRSSWQNGEPPRGAYVYLNRGRRYRSFD